MRRLAREGMRAMGLGRHFLVFGALVVNLWVGGEFVEAVAGQYVRGAFEMALILGYMVLVLKMRFPLRRRREP